MNRRPSKSRKSFDSFSERHTARFTASSPDNNFFEERKKKPLASRAALALLLLLCAALIVNFAVNQFVHVARVSVPVHGLDEAFEGYAILHISDLKGARFGPDQMFVRTALHNKEYDAVVLTGDMVSSMGNAEPLYELLDVLRELNPTIPIYFIAGDDDPVAVSMDYADGGSPFAPWVLGARQRGAQMLSAPVLTERSGQRLWLATSSQLNLDIETMQGQYELQYLSAMASEDENEIELAKHNLLSLENTRTARDQMTIEDIFITATHVPPTREELAAVSGLSAQVDLILSGHYLGGLIRLPALGALFIPSRNLPMYGLLAGGAYCGLDDETRPLIYTSPGLGSRDDYYPAFFFRLFNPPTMTIISLTPSAL